jgi:hypothetical protein
MQVFVKVLQLINSKRISFRANSVLAELRCALAQICEVKISKKHCKILLKTVPDALKGIKSKNKVVHNLQKTSLHQQFVAHRMIHR